MFSAVVGASPAAVYIESAAGTAAGGKTGLTAITVGILFLLILFLSPLSYLVPGYATAPALMYVGLLMLSNVARIDFNDFVDAMSGLITAVMIVLTCNIVTGIMIGFATLVIGRFNLATAVQKTRLMAGFLFVARPSGAPSGTVRNLPRRRSAWSGYASGLFFYFQPPLVSFCVNLGNVNSEARSFMF